MILCCGEALIDMLPRTTTDGEPAFAPYPGGAVFNTAIALGRLGAPVGLFCGLSEDLFGDMLVQALAASDVDVALCPRRDQPTTLAFVQLQDAQARYAFHDENSAMRMVSPDDLPPLPAHVTALFFGGISLVSEPCGSAFEKMMTLAADHITMIDPNIRPGFIRDEAAYRARLERMIALADIVKLSDEDLHWLEGEGEVPALAQRILSRGPGIVVITEGARGATAFRQSSSVSAAAQRVEVVDTVGAGDTFNAGFLAALHRAGALNRDGLRGLDDAALAAALELGAGAAAVTVSRAGANPPWARELA